MILTMYHISGEALAYPDPGVRYIGDNPLSTIYSIPLTDLHCTGMVDQL